MPAKSAISGERAAPCPMIAPSLLCFVASYHRDRPVGVLPVSRRTGGFAGREENRRSSGLYLLYIVTHISRCCDEVDSRDTLFVFYVSKQDTLKTSLGKQSDVDRSNESCFCAEKGSNAVHSSGSTHGPVSRGSYRKASRALFSMFDLVASHVIASVSTNKSGRGLGLEYSLSNDIINHPSWTVWLLPVNLLNIVVGKQRVHFMQGTVPTNSLAMYAHFELYARRRPITNSSLPASSLDLLCFIASPRCCAACCSVGQGRHWLID